VTTADAIERPRGWDVGIDATGNAHAIQDALGRVGKGGTYLQFGVADYAARATIAPYRIYNEEITIYAEAMRQFQAGKGRKIQVLP
jgi:threonine dehydrogenase-like Zn-dependent dehydrogenase